MKILLAVTPIVLAACTTVSPVTPLGNNTYLVGTSVRGGFTSDTEVKTVALQRAMQFCQGQGKTMVVTGSQSSGVQGWTPQNAEVTFTCADEKK